MIFSSSKLRGRIIEKFGTIGKFAESLGCSSQTISNYFNGTTNLSQDKIIQWCELLDIKEKDIPAYFFTPKVDETEQ